MPTLDLLIPPDYVPAASLFGTSSPFRDVHAGVRLWTRMLFANDDEKRYTLLNLILSDDFLAVERDVTVQQRFVRRWRDLECQRSSFAKAVARAEADGIVAGEFLRIYTQAAVHHPWAIAKSARQIEPIVSATIRNLAKQGLLSNRTATTRIVERQLRRMAPVAHLWVGYLICRPDGDLSPIQALLENRTYLPILSLANKILSLVAQQANPPVAAAEAWRPPEDIALPDVEFAPPPLDDDALGRVSLIRRI